MRGHHFDVWPEQLHSHLHSDQRRHEGTVDVSANVAGGDMAEKTDSQNNYYTGAEEECSRFFCRQFCNMFLRFILILCRIFSQEECVRFGRCT